MAEKVTDSACKITPLLSLRKGIKIENMGMETWEWKYGNGNMGMEIWG